jgi:NitT/TauT family transport system substrate-binding protein
MKKIISLLLAMVLAVSLAACGQKTTADDTTENDTPAERVTIRLGGLKGPTSMGMVKLLDDAENGGGQNDYTFTMAASANELTPQLVQGELDVLAVPANVAAILYNQTEGGVVTLAAGTLGVLYIVEKGGETVTDITSLNGKTIYATGKGATPEYALTYLLAQHGLTLGEDVQVEWKSEPTEIVAQMAQEDNAVAMLPQPFVTVAMGQVEGLRVALDLNATWDALDNGSRLITSVLVARKEFADAHPAALAAFLEDYSTSTDYANSDPAGAAVLVEKYGIVKAAVAEKALPQCNLVCITGVDMKVAVSGYLQTLYDLKAEAVGGTMPADAFYWMGA